MKTYFCIYTGFEKGFKTIFGKLNEEKQDFRALLTIKQKGSCTKYTAEFLRYATKVIWGDSALCT